MSSKKINIDRLQVRVRGVPTRVARQASADLGSELIGQLSLLLRPVSGKNAKISVIDIGRVQLPEGAGPDDLRQAITRHVAASISRTVNQGE